jgi:hypothetical protein
LLEQKAVIGLRKDVAMKWTPLQGAKITLQQLPGWVFQLTHNGTRTLGVWTNGKSVWTVVAFEA